MKRGDRLTEETNSIKNLSEEKVTELCHILESGGQKIIDSAIALSKNYAKE